MTPGFKEVADPKFSRAHAIVRLVETEGANKLGCARGRRFCHSANAPMMHDGGALGKEHLKRREGAVKDSRRQRDRQLRSYIS